MGRCTGFLNLITALAFTFYTQLQHPVIPPSGNAAVDGIFRMQPPTIGKISNSYFA